MNHQDLKNIHQKLTSIKKLVENKLKESDDNEIMYRFSNNKNNYILSVYTLYDVYNHHYKGVQFICKKTVASSSTRDVTTITVKEITDIAYTIAIGKDQFINMLEYALNSFDRRIKSLLQNKSIAEHKLKENGNNDFLYTLLDYSGSYVLSMYTLHDDIKKQYNGIQFKCEKVSYGSTSRNVVDINALQTTYKPDGKIIDERVFTNMMAKAMKSFDVYIKSLLQNKSEVEHAINKYSHMLK